MRLSAIDRKILNSIQDNIPLNPQPFALLSRRLGIKEAVLLEKVKELKGKGIIRRLSAGINHKRLGFASTLIGLNVSLNKLEPIVKEVVRYNEVTHCFLREGEYNLWIVFIYKGNALKEFLKKVSSKIGKKNIANLKTIKKFKLDTKIKI